MARIPWCLVGLLCLAGAAHAMGSAGFDLGWNVMGGGGGVMTSTSQGMGSTLGQVAGTASSPNYQLEAGYWVSDEGVTPPQKGRLLVNSTPDGAGIFLSGANTGKITNSSFDLGAGLVTVSVVKRCYFPVKAIDVTIVPGKTVEAAFELTPVPSCNPIPEFPTMVVPAISLIAMAGVIILVRRMKG
jgi:hypothetical protein